MCCVETLSSNTEESLIFNFRFLPQKELHGDSYCFFPKQCNSGTVHLSSPRLFPPTSDISPLKAHEHFSSSLCQLSRPFSSSLRFPIPSSPCCPSALPLSLTIAKAQGVKFNSQMTVSPAQTHTNLHGCIHVLAEHLFSDPPA